MRLVIVGNGFDRFNGIKSCYSDFKNFILKNGGSNYISKMENYFPNLNANNRDNLLWSSFEDALECLEVETVISEATRGHKIDFDYAMRDTAIYEDMVEYEIQELVEDTQTYFMNWIESIQLTKSAYPAPFIDKNDIYISFNYTMTLENKYNVPEQNVLHIHGSILKGDLIFGHGRDYYAMINSELVYEMQAENNVINWINILKKPVQEVINSNLNFWSRLSQSNINEVIVFGHSLSTIDIPYFIKVIECIGNVHWRFSVYSLKDLRTTKSFIKNQNIQSYEIFKPDSLVRGELFSLSETNKQIADL
ncbi:MAG: bacteriophage abortive infection AbiH family protein [Sedimentibacter sp.]